MYKLFKNNHNFRFLYLGSIVSGLGDYLYDIAITLLVFDITQSINSIAFMWLSKGALRILVQYFGGILTDKFNRKKIIIITNLLSVPCALIFLIINDTNIWIAYLGVFLLQSLNDIDSCSEISILPEIVNKKHLTEANTLFSVTSNIIMFISLGISGVIYTNIGANILFLINSISFFVASAFFCFIKYEMKNKKQKISKFKLIDKSSLTIINKNYNCFIIILTSGLFAILSRLYDVYNIYIANTILNIGSSGIIYFRYAMAIGSIITPICIKYVKGNNELKKFFTFSEVTTIIFISLPLTKSLIFILIELCLFAMCLSLQSIYFRSILQKEINEQYMGRIFSTYKILITIISLCTVSLIPIINKFVTIKFVFMIVGCFLFIACLIFKNKIFHIKANKNLNI